MNILSIILLSIVTVCQSKNVFRIEEANIQFEAADTWEFFSKTGKLEQGKVQYSYSHPHVEGDGRQINPSITITLDKGSWFSSEEEYLYEKLDFHKAMDDTPGDTYPFGNDMNPLKELKAYYTICESGTENHPYGQLLILIDFWNDTCGFHMEIQTSKMDFEQNADRYMLIFNTLQHYE